MALEGTIKTPLGTVQKKTALILGGGVAVIIGIAYWRQKQIGDQTVTTAEAEINPATGYPYGSPEDAAALAAQAAYVSPPANGGGGGGGGSGSIPVSNAGYTTNQEWSNAVVQNLTGNGLVENPQQLSVALGHYLTGAYAPDPEPSLIAQAIAAEGYPPIAGTTGYPPSINRTPPQTGTTKPPDQTEKQNITNVTGLKLSNATATTLTFTWSYGAVKPDYQLVYKDSVPVGNISGNVLTYTMRGLPKNSTHRFQVRGVKHATIGPSSSTTGKTKAK